MKTEQLYGPVKLAGPSRNWPLGWYLHRNKQ